MVVVGPKPVEPKAPVAWGPKKKEVAVQVDQEMMQQPIMQNVLRNEPPGQVDAFNEVAKVLGIDHDDD